MATLAVVIPATNGPRTLDACLAAVRAADDPPDELIVVADPSAASPAAARNLGVSRSTAEIVAFVDADVTVKRDAFARIRAAFDADEELVAVFGSYDDDPPAGDPVSGFRNLLHHHVHHGAGGRVGTFWAGLGAVRRNAFDAAGGFVEHPIEDIELGMRLNASGAKIELDPAIQGAHLKRWSLLSMVRTDLLVRGAPWVGLLLLHRPASMGLNLGWRHRLSALASVALIGLLVVAPLFALVALAALVALNVSFYRLLLRRRGVLHTLAGIALHVVHHLVSVAAVVLGIVLYWRRRPRAPETGVPVGSQGA
ncbi:MAG TPA: glycosyltransferase family 2 protein [Gaiellaceae bacterium]|nr:glycosyltransferase family 2 protein [Gaiellaceae bacterium]